MPNDNNFKPANFDPILQKYDGVPYLRFWCQKVLPAVYDQSLSYYEVLCKLAAFLNKTVDEMEKIENNTDSLFESFKKLQAYVNNILSHYDVNGAVDNKLDEMYANGQLATLIDQFIPKDVILIADSFGLGTTPDVPENERKGWTYWFKQYAKGDYGTIFENSKGGSSFLARENRDWLTMLTEMANNPDIDNNKVGYIIVVGGHNDVWRDDRSNLTSLIQQFGAYVKNTFPHARYYLGFCCNTIRYNSLSYDELKFRELEVMRSYQANANGGTFISGLDTVLLSQNSATISSDGVHPTQNMYARIGAYIAKFLSGGIQNYTSANNDMFNVRGNTTYFTATNDLDVNYNIVNNAINISLKFAKALKKDFPLDGTTILGHYTLGSPIRSDVYDIGGAIPLYPYSDIYVHFKRSADTFNQGVITLSTTSTTRTKLTVNAPTRLTWGSYVPLWMI